MGKPAFSVIIPVYNSEKFLGQCVKSVLSQSYGDFEIILVDDASTDRSGEICDSFADERIKVFHKENEGPLLTRVFGVSKAEGDFCIFIDSDDYIDDGYFERLNTIIKEENCDIVVCSFKRVEENKTVNAVTPWKEKKTFFADGLNEFRRCLVLNSFLNSMCTKTIRTELLKSDPTDFTEFSQFRNGEDLIESLMPVFNAKKIVYIPECFYNYRVNSSSITHCIDPDRYKSTLAVREHTFYVFKDSAAFNEEVCTKYANVTIRSLMNFIKGLEKAEISFSEKKDVCEAISSNVFYQSCVLNNYCKSELSKSTKMIFELFRKKRYKAMFFLIHCFFEVKTFEKFKNKQNN